MDIYNLQNQPITLTTALGKGGEATIYHIAEQHDLVAKIYHQPTSKREAKLRAMLLNPPQQPTTHVAIAWPVGLLYKADSQIYALIAPDSMSSTNGNESISPFRQSEGQFVGFLMPKITGGRSIFHIYNPILRQQLPHFFNWHALHRTAYNLCRVVEAIHAKGYVIGDINESNILVNREALVTIVDCDSFQVADEQGTIHRCQVGKPEYTPPELQGIRLSEVDQAVEHDLFGLAVLLFQLLMDGYHPFAGVLQSQQSVGRVDLYAIREGLFPYVDSPRILPSPHAPKFNHLHPQIQTSFCRCFVDGNQQPRYRPNCRQWLTVLKNAEIALQPCQEDKPLVCFGTLTDCRRCQQITKRIVSSSKKDKPSIENTDLESEVILPIAPAPQTIAPQTTNANLQGQDLRHLNFNSVKISQSNLQAANLQGVPFYRADLVKSNLSGANLSGADLTDTRFHSIDLSGADLSGANLTNTKFQATNLQNANLCRARLVEANLVHCNIERAQLIEANLRNASLEQANLREANLTQAILVGADLSQSKLMKAELGEANLRGVILERADLSEANLRGAILVKADLSRSKLIKVGLGQANLRGATLERATLLEADLTGAVLVEANLSHCRLMKAELGTANLSGTRLKQANLSEANLRGAVLIKAKLLECEMVRIQLAQANLRRADLEQVKLTNANLQRADLGQTNLVRANLSNANLTRANLRGSNLAQAQLTGANLQGADLREVKFFQTDLSRANLSQARLSRDITNARLTGATMPNGSVYR